MITTPRCNHRKHGRSEVRFSVESRRAVFLSSPPLSIYLPVLTSNKILVIIFWVFKSYMTTIKTKIPSKFQVVSLTGSKEILCSKVIQIVNKRQMIHNISRLKGMTLAYHYRSSNSHSFKLIKKYT